MCVSLDQVKSLRLKTDNLKKERTGLETDDNNTYKVMAVRDGDVADININLRGDPHERGKLVPRGFLSKITPRKVLACADGSSGRLELAKWMDRARSSAHGTCHCEQDLVLALWQGDRFHSR